VAIDIHDPNSWVIHDNIEQAVDLLLQGQNLPLQKRSLLKEKGNFIDCKIVYNNKNSTPVQENSFKRSGVEKKSKNNPLLNKLNQKGHKK
jgi:hypothetical protein